MSDSYNSKFLDDPEFQSLLVGCLESLQRGETIDRQALAKDFPKYAAEIGKFLQDRQLLEQVASGFGDVEPSRVTISAYEQTIDSGSGKAAFSVGESIRYIGEYEVLEEIARGGMGIVFKARQQKLNRIVALKMILAGRLADKADVERFHREARAAGRLKHVNIVPVHEIGEYEGRQYFTMDFVEGQSLAEIIRHETLSPQKAARTVKVMAEAVQYAHHEGIVHRDLKPANVLMDQEGEPHITDFGLARMLESVDEESRAELTATGQILGTPSYMSPEQASGKHALVGPPSDIYSLGAILYASLTGRAPFVADSPVDTLLQVMRNEPVSPRDLNPSVPKDLETICLKCLSKEPHKRYGTAQELADDLNRFLEGRPVVARPVGPINKAIRWCRRNKLVASLLTLVFLSLTAGVIISAYFAETAIRHSENERHQRLLAVEAQKEAQEQRASAVNALTEAETQRDAARKSKATAERALTQEEKAREEAEKARESEAEARKAVEVSLAKEEVARQEAETSRRDALWQTYVARLQPMVYRFEQREYGQLEAMLQQAGPQSEDLPDFRGWEWHYLNGLCYQQTVKVFGETEVKQFFDWHPATKRLVVFRKGELELWSGEPLEFQKRFAVQSPGLLRFSPDGTQVAIADDFNVKILSVASGDTLAKIDLSKHQNTHRNSKRITSLDWRPDSSALATGTNMGAVHLWDPKSGELIKPISLLPNDFPCNEMHWHPQEPLLAIATRYGQVFAIDTEKEKREWVTRIDRDYTTTVRWSPSGTRIAGATNGVSDGARLVVWDRDGKEIMRSAGGAITGTPTIEWLNDEELFAATTDHDICRFQVESEFPTETFRVHAGPVLRILRYGDGDRILSSTTDELRVTRVSDKVKVVTSVEPHKFGIKAISWSPDSRRVATVSWDRVVAITDMEKGEVLNALEGHSNGAVNDVDWSPDGLRVASCDIAGEFRIWDPDAAKLLLSFKGGRGSGGFNSVTWIDDDHIVGGEKTQRIFDANSGEAIRSLSESLLFFANLAYSPERRLIAHLASERLTIFDHEARIRLESHVKATQGLAWSPDGKLLITGGDAGIGVFDCVNLKFLTTIKGHAGNVTDVCFSPDGSRIASSGRDGTVRVWDRATGAELLILEHPDVRSFTCVDWSPDGTTIAAGANKVAVAWHAALPRDASPPISLATGMIASVKSPAEVVAELSNAIDDSPEDVSLLRKRGDLYAEQLMWQEALADYERVLELRPNHAWEAVSAARAALMLGNREEYQKHTAVLVERFLGKNAPDHSSTADFVASTAALLPYEDLQLDKLLSLSKAHSEAKGRALWASRGVVMLQLRLGNHAEVLKMVEQYQSDPSSNHRIFIAAAKALAHHQAKDKVAAKEALALALDLADKTWFVPAEGDAITYSNTGIFVEASILLDEAEQTILNRRTSIPPTKTLDAKPSKNPETAIANPEGYPHSIKGEWKVRQMQRGGVKLEQSDIESDMISFSQDEVNLPGFGTNVFKYQLANSQSKGTIDFTGKVNNKSQEFRGLYEIKDDTLTMVINEWPNGQRPKQFLPIDEEDSETPNTHRLYVVLQRTSSSSSSDELKASSEDEVIKQE